MQNDHVKLEQDRKIILRIVIFLDKTTKKILLVCNFELLQFIKYDWLGFRFER